MSKSFEGQTDKTEEWYGTQYKQEAISEESLKVKPETIHTTLSLNYTHVYNSVFWSLFQKWASADLNGKFKLPMRNEFIPTNFEIYPLEKDSPSIPTLIKASVCAALRQDQSSARHYLKQWCTVVSRILHFRNKFKKVLLNLNRNGCFVSLEIWM